MNKQQPTSNTDPTTEYFTDKPNAEPSEPFAVLSVDPDMQEVMILEETGRAQPIQARDVIPLRLWSRNLDKYVAYTSSFRTAALRALLATTVIKFPEDGNGEITEQPYAEWATLHGSMFDEFFGREHLTPNAVREIHADASDFIEGNWSDIENLDPQAAGQDFILSRNGHKGGFSDRGYGSPEQRSRLHLAATVYGHQRLQVNRNYQVEVNG